jgi:hypothetical protein
MHALLRIHCHWRPKNFKNRNLSKRFNFNNVWKILWGGTVLARKRKVRKAKKKAVKPKKRKVPALPGIKALRADVEGLKAKIEELASRVKGLEAKITPPAEEKPPET